MSELLIIALSRNNYRLYNEGDDFYDFYNRRIQQEARAIREHFGNTARHQTR